MSSASVTKLFNRIRGEKALRRLDTTGGMSITLSVDKRDIILDPTGVFPGDVTIGGDLTVNGTTTTVNSTVTTINDNIITLNEGELAAGVATLGTKSGIEIDRGSLENVRWIWDETVDKFRGEFVSSGNIADVEVNSLMFTDHGSNAQMWSIEEDSSGSNTQALTFDYAGTERLRMTPTGNFADNEGNVILGLTKTGEDAVNWVDVKNAISGSGPVIAAVGSDTNIDLELRGKGTGNVSVVGDIAVTGLVDGVDIAAHTGAGGAVHANVVASGASGFMTGVDKTKLDGISAGADVTSVFGRDGAVVAVAGDYTASEITNVAAGTIAAITVQTALNELDTEKLANVVEDTNPILGGNLDVGFNALVKDTQVILDFVSGGEDGVNHIEMVTAITATGAIIRSAGADTNVDFLIDAKGTGDVVINGRNTTTDGTKLDGIEAGATVNTVLTGSAALDFASIASLGQADLTIAVASAVVGDEVALGLPAAPTAGLIFNAFVDSAGSVTVRAHNYTAGAIDAASATYNVRVFQ